MSVLGKKLHAGERPWYERYGVVVVVALLLGLPAFIEPAYAKFLPILVGVLALGVGSIAGLLWALSRNNLKLVALHEEGMVVSRRGTPVPVLWEEVKSITQCIDSANDVELENYDVNFGDSVRISFPRLGADKANALLACITERAGLEWDADGRIAARDEEHELLREVA
jgi:hypothetical protein